MGLLEPQGRVSRPETGARRYSIRQKIVKLGALYLLDELVFVCFRNVSEDVGEVGLSA